MGWRFCRRLSGTLAKQVVSGPEEARLIYLGVLSGMDFAEHPRILDIGGGSTS